MKNLHNIDKSAFRKGEYVGYASGLVFRIMKRDGMWFAYCDKTQDRLRCPTLWSLSVALENYIPAAA
jgi:hypothetical protein